MMKMDRATNVSKQPRAVQRPLHQLVGLKDIETTKHAKGIDSRIVRTLASTLGPCTQVEAAASLQTGSRARPAPWPGTPDTRV